MENEKSESSSDLVVDLFLLDNKLYKVRSNSKYIKNRPDEIVYNDFIGDELINMIKVRFVEYLSDNKLSYSEVQGFKDDFKNTENTYIFLTKKKIILVL